jgi:UDP-GlcNAc3NAcA epimerase
MVLVYGDTNSTLATALAASKLLIPLAHVEAGLRSFNRSMPEEVNRVLTDHVSDLLFCPTSSAVSNLASEGIDKGVYNVGDVMFDAARYAFQEIGKKPGLLETLGLTPGRYAVATLHRAENTDSSRNLEEVLDWIKHKARKIPVVLPLHPRTRIAAQKFGLGFEGLTICEPVSYLDMARLLNGAVEVYTDSGGLQKEAYFHKKRCVTLRDETEWLETIECGWNRLWKGPDFAPQKDILEFGDGNAADVIVGHIWAYLEGP